MTASTTAVNACNARVYLDNASGVLTEITGSSTGVTLNLSKNIGEWKPFNYGWKKRSECERDWKPVLNAVYTTTAAEALGILRDWFFGTGGARTIRIDMPDSATGSDRYEGEVLLESLDIPMEAGNASPVAITATFAANGEMTHNIIGS